MKKLVGVLSIIFLLFATGAKAVEEKISMDFSNVEIAVVVKYISDLTGKNFIIDEKVRGNVTIISPKKVSKKEAYKVFESILEVYGFAAIPSGSLIKIVPITEARQKAGDVRIGGEYSKDARDSMLTQLIPLKFVPAKNLVPIIRPLIPSTSHVASYDPSNTLIVVDLAANRQRILEIIKELDVESTASQITVHRLSFATAGEIAKKITTALGTTAKAKSPGKGRAKVIPDERTNALIIVGNDLYIKRVKQLVAELDIESPPGREEVHVIYLKYANAEELGGVINNLAAAAKKNAKKKGKKATVSFGSENITVTADKATNSLLITASPEDFETVKNIVDKLDIRRKQVFVEALIFEISTDDTQKFGVEWRTTSDFTKSGIQGIGGTNFGSINSVAVNPLTAGQGLVLGVVDGTINFAGKEFLNIGGLVQALQLESGINILSTPNILTTDNEEAEIFVGEEVPFIKSTVQSASGDPIENIERKKVGMTLRITPQINDSDYIRLKIFQEMSSISATQLAKARDIITFERRAETTVIVKNHQNIIIGGLIRDDYQDVISKVPFLGDLPIIGWLFKSTERKKSKTNLLIFLTPHIIEEAEDLDKITEKKRQLMESLKPKKDEEKKENEPDDSMPEENNETPGITPADDTESGSVKKERTNPVPEITLFGGEEEMPTLLAITTGEE